MARPRAASYEDQRDAIRAAAAALFARRGFTAATMNEVAAASGVSKATLYHYFSDKHSLLEDIVRSHVARLEALVGIDPLSPSPSPARGEGSKTVASSEPWPTGPSPARGERSKTGGSSGPGTSSPSPLAGEGLGRGGAAEALAIEAPPEQRLRRLIHRFMLAYAGAQNEHRVLTEDVKFLDERACRAVLDGQRRVVAAFAQAIADCRPDLAPGLRKPLAMLVFGMINWTFTWLEPDGPLTHEALGGVVADLFFGGLGAVDASGPPAAAGPGSLPT
jgi:AcrR family transcriptional regulator